jgi:hypothetical protein
MQIQVSRDPPFVLISGLRIVTAPPVADLLKAIGMPTRVDTGSNPAPPGFRNNQIHIFDSLGVYINEHHHTRRAEGITLALLNEPQNRFSPTNSFSGELTFNSATIPLRATETQFLKASPWQFEHFIAGSWSCRFDGFYIGFDAIGSKLPSGRRSKRRMVASVNISWPHDPRGDPVSEG